MSNFHASVSSGSQDYGRGTRSGAAAASSSGASGASGARRSERPHRHSHTSHAQATASRGPMAYASDSSDRHAHHERSHERHRHARRRGHHSRRSSSDSPGALEQPQHAHAHARDHRHHHTHHRGGRRHSAIVKEYRPSDEEVLKYAIFLGLDPDRDQELMWIPKAALMSPLPPPWVVCHSSQGKTYFFNPKSGESRWTHPNDAHYRQQVAQERGKTRAKRRSLTEPAALLQQLDFDAADPAGARHAGRHGIGTGAGAGAGEHDLSRQYDTDAYDGSSYAAQNDPRAQHPPREYPHVNVIASTPPLAGGRRQEEETAAAEEEEQISFAHGQKSAGGGQLDRPDQRNRRQRSYDDNWQFIQLVVKIQRRFRKLRKQSQQRIRERLRRQREIMDLELQRKLSCGKQKSQQDLSRLGSDQLSPGDSTLNFLGNGVAGRRATAPAPSAKPREVKLPPSMPRRMSQSSHDLRPSMSGFFLRQGSQPVLSDERKVALLQLGNTEPNFLKAIELIQRKFRVIRAKAQQRIRQRLMEEAAREQHEMDKKLRSHRRRSNRKS